MRRSMRVGTMAFALLSLGGLARPAQAAFHLWGINEVYSTLDGIVQFVEMQTDAGSFEVFTNNTTFTSNSNSAILNHDLDDSTFQKTFLIASPGYVDLANSPGSTIPQPDFVFPTNNFFSVNGDRLEFVGADGDGTHPDVLIFTSGQLPTDGVQSMRYNFVTELNSPKNFDGETGTVVVPEPTVMGAMMIGGLLVLSRRRNRA